MTFARRSRFLALLLLALLAACRGPQKPALTLSAARFADLPGWGVDHQSEALAALIKSCAELGKRDETAVMGPAEMRMTAAAWRAPCAEAAQVAGDDAAARDFFERNFTPYLAGNRDESDGLFTGYYEPLLNGARERGGPYQTPLLKRPPDLVMVELGRFRPAWRGERIAGRVTNGSLLPYPSRAEIERGALDAMHLQLFWVDDPADAFFLQVQGSGRVKLSDGTLLRVGYDGQNGQAYVALGKLLIDRGIMTREEVSLQSIKAWIKAHPAEGLALMDENPSYVFFRELQGDGPLGAEGVVLTPARSLAVDRSYIPLGVPLFLVTRGDIALQRLMVAQDTGGAINGPVRGDVFWGFGTEAEAKAGAMRATGRYYLLLPKTVTPPRELVIP